MSAPAIGAGSGFTVILDVAIQPVGIVYVTSTVFAVGPERVPVSMPDELMVPTDAGVALQVPPRVSSVSVIDNPVHTAVRPAMVSGNGFTLTATESRQPVGRV